MRAPTLNLRQKRIVVCIWLAVFLFAVGNRFLEWGIFGRADKVVYAVVMLIGVLGMVRFVPKMMEEIEAHQAAQKQVEGADELARDKSGDAAQTERLRPEIGKPPGTSLERARER